MLNDHERELLREVERQLATDDPAFARSFDANTQRLPRREHGVGRTIALSAAALLAALMLVAGSPGTALAFAAVCGLLWFVSSTRPTR